MTGQRSHGG